MTKYEISPFEITEDFEACWLSAGRHLNLRVQDAGAWWLRAELPCFREHLSFALGNQLFFIQFYDVDNPNNGWKQIIRLETIANDANGFPCLMPMRKIDDTWEAVISGWGLIDLLNEQQIDPFQKISDEPIEMTQWEIHDFGIQSVKRYLVENGWEIASWQSDLGVNPSIFASKNDEFCGFVVRTSNKGSETGQRPENCNSIAKQMSQRGWGAKFVGLKVASADDAFDPRLQHLTRKIMRRSKILMSRIEIEELARSDD
jgi:hypothetical protein